MAEFLVHYVNEMGIHNFLSTDADTHHEALSHAGYQGPINPKESITWLQVHRMQPGEAACELVAMMRQNIKGWIPKKIARPRFTSRLYRNFGSRMAGSLRVCDVCVQWRKYNPFP